MTTPPPSAGGLAPDEKLCPYCAETIKAAAVRCRYCQSDLTDGAKAAPVSLSKDDAGDGPEVAPLPVPPPEVELADDPEVDEPAAGPQARRGRPDLVVVGLLVLCLALGGTLWLLVHRSQHPHLDTAPNGQVTQGSFRNAVMSAASDAAAQAFSYSYKTFDADRKKTEGLLAPGSKAARQYADAMDEVAPQTASAKITQKATVLSAGVISAREHSAKVLLFVNTITTREGAKNQQLKQSRVVMELTRKDGDWTVTDMTPI